MRILREMANISFPFFMVFVSYHKSLPRPYSVRPVRIPTTKSVYPVMLVLRTISASGVEPRPKIWRNLGLRL